MTDRISGPRRVALPPAGPGGFDWHQAVPGVIAMHREGRLDSAQAAYEQLLQLLPEHPDLTHFYGVLLHQRGRVDEALSLVRRSIALDPNVASWHNNLGNMLLDRQEPVDAAQAYQRCLELDADNAEVRNNLGNLLRQCGLLNQSEAVLRDAVARRSGAAETHVNLALVLAAQQRIDEAMEEVARALELKPDNPRSRRLLGLLYARRGRTDLAAQVFRDWLARSPNDPQASHHLAAVTGQDVPERASDAYVVELFDRFAAGFDVKLAGLDYRAPELCIQVVHRRVGAPADCRRVLDAGCGTGLCGPLLRPFARELIGVDLSGGMLARARLRSVYDSLEQAELGAWLDAPKPSFDLIVSADTLCYFGALGRLLGALRRACCDGGWLVFTVEALDDTVGQGFKLQHHGRYAHEREAVRCALIDTGWQLVELEAVTLRQEAGQPVQGWLVSAQATPSAVRS